jgi:heme-degrading monooxygenase HmoA
MFEAMNKFWVNEDRHQEFEEVWKNRDRHLSGVPGFKNFKLLKGSPKEGDEKRRPYISYSLWESEEEFWAWTKSEAFKKAHQNRTPEGIIMGPPEFSGYTVILDEH